MTRRDDAAFLLLWFCANICLCCRSFASACNLQEVEDQGELMKIIQGLTEALVQPLETSEPAPDPEPEPEPELELLLVLEEEKKQQESSVKSQTALQQVFHGDSDQESFVGFQDD